MITVEQVVEWCKQNELLVEVYYDKISAGGHIVKGVDLSGYRVEHGKTDVQDVWYSKYDLRFNPQTREVIFGTFSEREKEFDIRNHPNWNL